MAKSLEELEKEKLAAEIKDITVWSPIKALATGAVSIATLALSYYGFLAENSPLKKSLEIEAERISIERKRLDTSKVSMGRIFSNVINEPSGIETTCLSSNGTPIFLVVDDEERTPFLVQRVGDVLLPIASLALIVPNDNGEFDTVNVEDLEAVTALSDTPFCQNARYLVTSSHRRHDEITESRAITFSLQQPLTEAESFRANNIHTFSFTDSIIRYLENSETNLFDFAEKLGGDGDLKGYEINGRKWWKREQEAFKQQQFALEIEASLSLHGELWLGLKYPLKDQQAVVLRNALDDVMAEKTSNQINPIGHKLIDLDGNSFSAMTRYYGCVLVASNPSEKRYKDQSNIHIFSSPSADQLDLLQIVSGAPLNTPGAEVRLEGIVVQRASNDIWASYDGGSGKIGAIRLLNLGELATARTLEKCKTGKAIGT